MPIVLVHGASFAASCWEPLNPYLDGETLAVDLPGRGRHPVDLEQVTQASCAASVVADIVERDLHDVVLVGHSMAGVTVPRVVDLIPERIKRLVFISSSVPRHGQSVMEALAEFGSEHARAASDGADGEAGQEGLSGEAVTAMFCNDMTPEQTAATFALMVPEATGLLTEPADLNGLRHPIPRTWIRLTDDALAPVATQDWFISHLGPIDVVDLDAGHMAMISRPQELAAVISALV